MQVPGPLIQFQWGLQSVVNASLCKRPRNDWRASFHATKTIFERSVYIYGMGHSGGRVLLLGDFTNILEELDEQLSFLKGNLRF